jgi:hypothetical protein
MEFKETLKELILKKRNIKPTTLKAYILNLSKILKMSDMDETIENLDSLLEDSSLIMKILEDKKPSTIRNYLASIVVYLSHDDENKELLDEYRKLMETYQKQNNENISNNSKTDSQKKNWATLEELRKILKNYKKLLDLDGALKKDELSKKQFDILQKYLVGNLYIGDDSNPPLRNDYIMEIINKKDYDSLTEKNKKDKNYLVVKNKSNKFFSLGNYKTEDKYGVKEIKVGKDLNRILNIWLKYNKSKDLLLNSKGEAMSANGLTKYLIKVFEPTGKKISSSILRSIYITEKFPPQTKEKEELASKMLHSSDVAHSVYAKDS